MMKRLLCLLLAILLPICPLSVALAEAQHTPYRPGALTRSLFLEAFQRGDAVCADLGQSLTLNAETLGLTGEDAELLSAVMDALSHTQITAAAVKLEDGVLLELAGTYFTEEDSVSIDAQLEITKTGLALTSDTVLPGERVTVTWETLLALLGVSEEDAGQLLALRSMSLQQLQEAAASYIRMFTLMAQQLAAPYAQILSDFVAAQPVSVEENVAAEGFFPAAAKETAVIVTSKAVGELLVTLCNQLEQDAALAPMLDALLAQAEPDSGIPSTTAALCAAVRQEAMTLTDEEYPLYLVTGTDADGRPLYGSLCAVLEDGSTAAINLIDCAETPEDGLSCLLQVFASDPEGVYTGLTASLDHTADPSDPQAISLSIAADVQAGVGLDQLHRHRVPEAVVGRCGKGAARLGLGHHVADFREGDSLPLHDNGPVQVLAALGGQVDALGGQDLVQAVKNGLADLRAGMAAHLVAGHLAGGAAHHQNLALPQLGDLADLLRRRRGFLSNLLQHSSTPRCFIGTRGVCQGGNPSPYDTL